MIESRVFLNNLILWYGLKAADVGLCVGEASGTVLEWFEGRDEPRIAVAEQLARLHRVAKLVAFRGTGAVDHSVRVRDWFYTSTPDLFGGTRPAHMFADGRSDEILAWAEALLPRKENTDRGSSELTDEDLECLVVKFQHWQQRRDDRDPIMPFRWPRHMVREMLEYVLKGDPEEVER